MIAVTVAEAEAVAAKMSHDAALYRLPLEAEWEKAARGGLIACRWSWGDEAPTRERCDFDRFGAFHLVDPRAFPPNGLGLYGMCGGVAEWTADRYDALAYARAANDEPVRPVEASEPRVLRGGSWADCAEAITVSFRTSPAREVLEVPRVADSPAPTIGFRLVRVARAR